MSLFIGGLAFQDGSDLMNMVKIGVIAGSLLSGICGCIVFLLSKSQKPAR